MNAIDTIKNAKSVSEALALLAQDEREHAAILALVQSTAIETVDETLYADSLAHGVNRDIITAVRKAIAQYHADHTSAWRIGANEFMVVTLLHPAFAGANNAFSVVRKVLETDETGADVWRNKRDYPRVSVHGLETDSPRVWFLDSSGNIATNQVYNDRKLAVRNIRHALGRGFVNSFADMMNAAKDDKKARESAAKSNVSFEIDLS